MSEIFKDEHLWNLGVYIMIALKLILEKRKVIIFIR